MRLTLRFRQAGVTEFHDLLSKKGNYCEVCVRAADDPQPTRQMYAQGPHPLNVDAGGH